jgi:hypothetical protein
VPSLHQYPASVAHANFVFTAGLIPSMIYRILFAAQIAATMISATDSPAIQASIVIMS